MTDAHLQLAHGALSPRRVDSLIERFGTVEQVVRAVVTGRTTIDRQVVDAVAVDASTRWRALQAAGIGFTVKGSTAYPSRLARHEAAPPWLFTVGDLPPAGLPTLAIVGTRTCTGYGRQLAHAYGSAAASMGWVVISGLAKGIDGAAHEGALSANGSCIAVLGSGIDVVYPRRHRALHGAVLACSGAVVSEFPPGTRPHAWRFPTRNRIIAGMADAVLVVEAHTTGGALITANIAIDMGVAVFATPGDVDRPASLGTNLLIRDGALPVFGADDLTEVLEFIIPTANVRA